MKVSKLKPNPNNPRKIAPDQLDKLKRSIESYVRDSKDKK